MPKAANHDAGRRPVLLVTVGRQRVGKTAFLNAIVQYLRQRGARLKIWNADLLNTTHTLSVFHPDVEQPPSVGPEDVKEWLVSKMEEQIAGQFDAVLDVGGGDTPFSRLVQQVPIVQTLRSRGIRVVLVHVVGPEQADLDYLKQFTALELVAPEATLIVLNAGLVLTGRSSHQAFAGIYEHPTLINAVDQGAVIATMPLLSCMSKVTDRGLTFPEAASGVTKTGARLSFFDEAVAAIWWTRSMPEFVGQIPETWLPAVSEAVMGEVVGKVSVDA